MTMNTTWGYSEHDQTWKSNETLIRNLVDIVSKGGNYLLNIGPKGDGSVPEESVRAMRAIGRWMAVNGQAIYGTSASPYEKPHWGRYTAKGSLLFAHLFGRPEAGSITVPVARVKQAAMLTEAGPRPLVTTRLDGGCRIELPASLPDPIVSVIRIELAD